VAFKGRRFGLYFAWSRPEELGAELGVTENRFPTLFEFRRALWPVFEQLRDPARYHQGIQGFIDHVILSDFEAFRGVITELTGSEVPVIQREGDRPPTGQLDDDLIKDIDTLIVVSLDHVRTGQTATAGEVDLVRAFLSTQGKCVVVCPHHDIGSDPTLPAQLEEFKHHRDITIPPQQRFSGFAQTLLKGLGFQIVNQFGLSPALAADGSPAPLMLSPELDAKGVLNDVTTFNLHPHLPHLFVPPNLERQVDVLARQAINPAAAAHPFVEAGNRQFNALLNMRSDTIGGTLLACDATLWSSAFGGLPSLRAFWRNLAMMKV
jgi:hypothetical protein